MPDPVPQPTPQPYPYPYPYPPPQASGTNYTLVLIIAVAVAGFLGYRYLPPPAKPNTPATPTAPDQPALTKALESFKAVATNAPDKEKVKRLGFLFLGMADVLKRTDSIQSNQLREWLISSDTYYMKGTDLVGSIPGIGAAKDKVLEESLGLEVRTLGKAEIEKAVNALLSMATLCGVKP